MPDLHITLTLSDDDKEFVSEVADRICTSLDKIAEALAPLNTTDRELTVKDDHGDWVRKPNPFYKEPTNAEH